MNFPEIPKLTNEHVVLIAPLDWGLGHATRCIPIIKQLLKLKCKVLIATDGPQKKILSEAFPDLQFLYLEGYKIKYSKNSYLFFITLFLQFPKIFRTIYKEHRWLKKVANDYKIDAVISDNRFGIFHNTLPCIYITHQVAVKTGFFFLDGWAKKLHCNIINRFNHCWVPDFEEASLSMAGALSHPSAITLNVNYIGCLSRFETMKDIPEIFDVLAVLSGPEPQRTIFEKQLLESFIGCKEKIFLVRGLPGNEENALNQNENLLIKNHLNQQELNLAMMQAKIVICRSGYTSVMDLLKIKQKAILIPTPGQAEQEYLADWLESRQFFYSVKQSKFNLQQALLDAEKFPYKFPDVDMNQYCKVVTKFVESL